MEDEYGTFLQMFREEAVEYVHALSSCLLDLEKDPGDLEAIQEGLRNAHSLKGCAQMIDLDLIARVAHAMEDVLRECESGKLQLTTEISSRMLAAADLLRHMVDQLPEVTQDGLAERMAQEILTLATPQAISGPEFLSNLSPPRNPVHSQRSDVKQETAPRRSRADDTIRVRTSKLDELQTLIIRLAMTELQMEDKFRRCQRLHSFLKEAPVSDLPACKESERMGTWLIEARGLSQKLITDFSENVLQLSNLSEEIQYQTMVTRMLPFGTVTGEFRRLVRDIAEELEKEVQIIVEGENQEVDRRLIEEIRAPIMHIVRNAIDHGIEPPTQRISSGKEPVGTITIRAERERGRVIITCEDDGQGLDISRLKQTAVTRGLATEEEVTQMGDTEAIYLIMRPGFTTATKVTEISGRGVGMDVVKKNVEKLRGKVEIQSQVHEFTRFKLILPLSLSLMNVLLISCQGNIFGIPVDSLESPHFIDPNHDIFTEAGQETILHHGKSIPLYSLDRLTGLDSMENMEHGMGRLKVVLIRHDEHQMALLVDDLLEQEKVAIESRGALIKGIPMVAGTSILGNGDPCIILYVPELFKAASTIGATGHGIIDRIKKGQGIARKKILVVEDSLTTRTMEKSILESFGYEVIASSSGEEALSLCETQSFDLLVTDIQMPGIDGFELIENLRKTKRFEDTPVVVVSSQYNEKNLQRGSALKVAAYIGKGSFQQSHLVDAVQSILGKSN